MRTRSICGLVASLNRPSGNVTGVTFLASGLGAKRFELLRYFVPNATAIAMLVNPNYPATAAEVDDVQAAARALGLRVNVRNAWTNSGIDAAFTTLGSELQRAFCRWRPISTRSA